MPRSEPSPSPDSRWLAMSLAALLSAPHPSLQDDDAVPLSPGADLFSIRFDEMFQPAASGYVCGRQVDRDELKQVFLSLRTRWDPDEGTAMGSIAHGAHVTTFHPKMAAKLQFTPLFRYPRQTETIIVEASGQEERGADRITCVMLDGDESLFRPEAY